MLQINTIVLRNWKDIKNIPKSILCLYLLVIASSYLNLRSAEANSIVLEGQTVRLDKLSENVNRLILLASNIKLENDSQNEEIEKLKKGVENHEKRIRKLEEENGGNSENEGENSENEGENSNDEEQK